MNDTEAARRREVLASLLQAIAEDRRIELPSFDPDLSGASPETALQSVGLEPNPFGGTRGEVRYQFEGEEDLLHLILTRLDAAPLSVESAQSVVGWLLRGVPAALIWLKPGSVTQHFYLGHDDVVTHLQL